MESTLYIIVLPWAPLQHSKRTQERALTTEEEEHQDDMLKVMMIQDRVPGDDFTVQQKRMAIQDSLEGMKQLSNCRRSGILGCVDGKNEARKAGPCDDAMVIQSIINCRKLGLSVCTDLSRRKKARRGIIKLVKPERRGCSRITPHLQKILQC